LEEKPDDVWGGLCQKKEETRRDGDCAQTSGLYSLERRQNLKREGRKKDSLQSGRRESRKKEKKRPKTPGARIKLTKQSKNNLNPLCTPKKRERRRETQGKNHKQRRRDQSKNNSYLLIKYPRYEKTQAGRGWRYEHASGKTNISKGWDKGMGLSEKFKKKRVGISE